MILKLRDRLQDSDLATIDPALINEINEIADRLQPEQPAE